LINKIKNFKPDKILNVYENSCKEIFKTHQQYFDKILIGVRKERLKKAFGYTVRTNTLTHQSCLFL
ncbi:MAG: hypothetical protein AAGA27_08120, partial [Pseudomonadota bacterium]